MKAKFPGSYIEIQIVRGIVKQNYLRQCGRCIARSRYGADGFVFRKKIFVPQIILACYRLALLLPPHPRKETSYYRLAGNVDLYHRPFVELYGHDFRGQGDDVIFLVKPGQNVAIFILYGRRDTHVAVVRVEFAIGFPECTRPIFCPRCTPVVGNEQIHDELKVEIACNDPIVIRPHERQLAGQFLPEKLLAAFPLKFLCQFIVVNREGPRADIRLEGFARLRHRHVCQVRRRQEGNLNVAFILPNQPRG